MPTYYQSGLQWTQKHTLTGDAGSLTLAGESATMGVAYGLSGSPGAMTLAGKPATFAHPLHGGAGALTLAGESAGMMSYYQSTFGAQAPATSLHLTFPHASILNSAIIVSVLGRGNSVPTVQPTVTDSVGSTYNLDVGLIYSSAIDAPGAWIFHADNTSTATLTITVHFSVSSYIAFRIDEILGLKSPVAGDGVASGQAATGTDPTLGWAANADLNGVAIAAVASNFLNSANSKGNFDFLTNFVKASGGVGVGGTIWGFNYDDSLSGTMGTFGTSYGDWVAVGANYKM